MKPILSPRIRAVLEAKDVPWLRRAGAGIISLALAAAVWLPSVHFFFAPGAEEYRSPAGISPKAKALAERHLELWTSPELRAHEIAKMRASNAEWDFMGRTFLVMALANMAMRDATSQERCLAAMDAIIDETVRIEREKGIYIFLMDYARQGRFAQDPPRSIFIDGEIAMMIGLRRLVQEREDYRPLLAERVEAMVKGMRAGKVLCAESYPNECWMFCNTVALASIRVADALDGTDHRDLFRDWLATAQKELVEPKTGMLFSSFSLSGSPIDGPEGSTIWMAAHCLQLIDEDFARDQYGRARKELGRGLLGFGYSREWPPSYVGPQDVDSGPVLPGLEASPGASGLALMGAAAFDDKPLYSSLCASLNFAAFPVERNGRLKYCASNQVGDAVMLYSMLLGPAWERVRGVPYPVENTEKQ